MIAIVRMIVTLVIAVLLLVVVGGAGLFAYLKTEAGQQRVVGLIESATESADMQVKLGSLNAALPAFLEVNGIQLADAEGVWLTIDRFRFRWHPTSLFKGKLKISELSFGTIDVARAPKTPPKEPEPAKPSGGTPGLPVTIEVDRFGAERIHLAEPVLGEEITLTFASRAAFLGMGERAIFELALDRIDATQASLTASFSFVPDTKMLSIDLLAKEPAGGLVVRTLALPGLPPLNASIQGKGLIEDWKGRFGLRAGSGFWVEGTAAIRELAKEKEAYALDLNMQANASALLDAKMQPLQGEAVRVTSRILFADSGDIRLERTEIEAPAGKFSLAGEVKPQSQEMDLDYQLLAGPSALFKELVPDVTWKTVQVSGNAGGTFAKPDVAVELSVASLTAAELTVPEIFVRLKALPDKPLGQPGTKLALTGNGRVALPEGGPPVLKNIPLEPLTWTVNAAVLADAKRVDLNSLHATLKAVVLDVNGRLDEWGQRAALKTRIALPDLAAFSKVAGMPLKGKLNLDLDTRVADAGQAAEVQLASLIQGLVTANPPVDALVGERVEIKGTLKRGKNGLTEVKKLTIETAAVDTALDAALKPDQTVRANWSVTVADLAPVAKALDKPLSGGIRMRGNASGSVDSPAVRVEVASQNLVFDGKPLKTEVALDARDLAKNPKGKLEVQAEAENIPATVSTRFALRNNEHLHLDDLRLASLGASIEGALKVALKSGTARGTLRGGVKDFSGINRLAQQKLSGDVNFKADLADTNGQDVTFALRGKNLRLDGESPLKVAKVEADGKVLDATGKLKLDSRVSIAGVENAAATVKMLDLTAKGGLEQLNFQLATVAVQTEGPELALKSAGVVKVEETGQTVVLNRFEGEAVKIPFKTVRPATFTMSGQRMALNDFILAIRDGKIAADFAMDSASAQAKVAIEKMPLALANVASPTLDLSGRLDGKVTLSTQADKPGAFVELAARDIKTGAIQDFPAASADVNVEWTGQEATLKLVAVQPPAANFDVDASVPLFLKQGPFGFELPPDAQLKAEAVGELVLERLNDLLLPNGDQIKGTVNLDARVSGTMKKPNVVADVSMDDGQFESLQFGTLIQAMKLKVHGDMQEVKLETFSGSTPNGGSLNASGKVDFSDMKNILADLSVKTDKAQLTAMDTMVAVVSSGLEFKGPLKKAQLKGDIVLDRVEVFLPNTLPPSVVVLDVEEAKKKGEGGSGEDGAEPKEKEPPMEIGLDVKVRTPNPIFVRGRGLDTQLAGNLHVTGTSLDPAVDGVFEMRKGSMDLLSRKVSFNKGVVSFDGVPRRDPLLDFKADIPWKDVVLHVIVKGPAGNPQIQLASTPELPQDEILARLLFDKTAGAMTPLEAVQLANSAAQLAGLGGQGPGIMDEVRGSLGLDTLKFGGGSGDTGPGVEAGKYVAEGVYVGVKQGLNTEQSSAVVEYEITPNVKVESDIGANSESRLGINMEWDY